MNDLFNDSALVADLFNSCVFKGSTALAPFLRFRIGSYIIQSFNRRF